MSFADSIVALSSGRPPAGLAVIRMSGPKTRFVVETMLGYLPLPRTMVLGAIKRPDGSVLDHGLTAFFPTPASFTGEDVAEFHLHGSRAVVAAALEVLASFPGVRFAEPGEFTRRAFLNGKLDLLQTEAMADLIQAQTEAQRRFAIQNADDVQKRLYEGWRSRLIRARALLEAELDFADEMDVPGSVSEQVWADVAMLAEDIALHADSYRRAEVIRDGFDVTIVGAPNAGKSSLLNALIRRDAAIVTDEPGTTRDLIEVAMDIEGIKIRLTDTAGLREAADKVEEIGVRRALERARTAALVLQVEDMERPAIVKLENLEGEVLRVGSKADRVEGGARMGYNFVISSHSGEGLEELLAEIGARAARMVGDLGDILPSRARHRQLLVVAREHLTQAAKQKDLPLELRAEELRMASDSLGRITGAVDVEDLLDVVFSEFCIGK